MSTIPNEAPGGQGDGAQKLSAGTRRPFFAAASAHFSDKVPENTPRGFWGPVRKQIGSDTAQARDSGTWRSVSVSRPAADVYAVCCTHDK